MSTSAIGGNATSPQARLLADLQKNGLSSDSASSVASEIDSVVQSLHSQSGSSTPTDPATVREAIESRIKSDVESGTLTQDQADAVTKTLDQLDQQMAKSGPPPGGAGGPPPGGPPPSGASSESSSDSSSESSSSSSSTVSAAQALQALLKNATENGSVSNDTADYVTSLLGSGLVDLTA